MRIVLEDSLDSALELAVRLAGFQYRNKGNCVGGVRSIAQGTHRIVKSASSSESRRWMLLADVLIYQKKPFVLTYKTQQAFQTFVVVYGEIVLHEDRFYLDARIEDKSINSLIELNRSFDFDRIIDLSPVKAKYSWGRLEYVDAVFKLTGEAMINYHRHDLDLRIVSIPDSLTINRAISSFHWFTRSVLVYGSECTVLRPTEVKTALRNIYNKGSQEYSK